MKFIPKMSGTRVEDFQIETIFDKQFVSLRDCVKKIKHQETMDFILDNFRFSISTYNKEIDGFEWYAILDYDTIYKISIMENYPQYKEELRNYFGEKWMNHYIRFNH